MNIPYPFSPRSEWGQGKAVGHWMGKRKRGFPGGAFGAVTRNGGEKWGYDVFPVDGTIYRGGNSEFAT